MEVDKILKDAEETAKKLNKSKLQGIKFREMTIDGLLGYCETVESLCKMIIELEKTIKKRDARIEYLETELNVSKEQVIQAASQNYCTICGRTLEK